MQFPISIVTFENCYLNPLINQLAKCDINLKTVLIE
jgi:hypothetical protein